MPDAIGIGCNGFTDRRAALRGGLSFTVTFRPLHRVAVSRVPSAFRREDPQSASADPVADYRARPKNKSTKAIDAALDCDLDSYMRGSVVIEVMRGLGEFHGGTQQGVTVFLTVPASWQTISE
jgi:hypothetical protein